MCIYMGVKKTGPFKCQKNEKILGIHILSFFKKRGFIIYLALVKMGAMSYIGSPPR